MVESNLYCVVHAMNEYYRVPLSMDTLADAVINALKHLHSIAPLSLDDSSTRAVNAVERVLKGSEQLAAVRGPPGTGKTTIYTKVFTDHYDALSGGKVAAYIAPTNVLVVETFSRQVANILRYKYGGSITERELVEVLKSMRAYGSKVIAVSGRARARLEDVFRDGLVECQKGSIRIRDCVDEVVNALRGVVSRPPTVELKYIFATEWQDIVSRSRLIQVATHLPSRFDIGLFVDEASRSPAYRPFMTIARLLAGYVGYRSGGSIPQSLQKLLSKVDVYGLSVIGDDMQAISVDELYKIRRNLLVLLTVHEVLGCRGWRGRQCSMLDKTKRLPKPTDDPISRGFYDGILDSVVEAWRRLAGLKAIVLELRSISKEFSGKKALVLNKVGDAIEQEVPLVVIETKTFEAGTLIERQRVAYAALIAAALAKAASAYAEPLEIAVTAPYSDMVDAARATFYRYMLWRVGLKYIPSRIRVRFATVHSMLGDEADIVITMLGKEWCGSFGYTTDDERVTMYCSEPEAFNVQMSRHRRLLVVVGDVRSLGRNMVYDKARRYVRRELARVVSGVGIAAREIENIAKRNNTLVSAT